MPRAGHEFKGENPTIRHLLTRIPPVGVARQWNAAGPGGPAAWPSSHFQAESYDQSSLTSKSASMTSSSFFSAVDASAPSAEPEAVASPAVAS